MSLFELLVIFIVALLLIKPEDLPKITKAVQEFNGFFTKIKKQIALYLEPDSFQNIKIEDNIEQINFYLEKIIKLGDEYEGEYSLEKIRNHYHKIIRKTLKDQELS